MLMEETQTEATPSHVDWEAQLAALLTDLSSVQEELLGVLAEKRQHMADGNTQGMTALAEREQEVLSSLGRCHEKRAELLRLAEDHELPSDSIRSLASALPSGKSGELRSRVKKSRHQARLLQQASLTNWVVAQQTLLHVSQLLEIIATGGRGKPTYGKGDTGIVAGSLVDRAA
jgi:flagellar biosynthesis/type III secretory pathway chaperone